MDTVTPDIWPSFEDFWDLYDKKRGKPNALKWWGKLTQKEREACMAAIPAYIEAQPDKQYRKDPERYLRHKAWEDEVIASKPNTSRPDQEGGAIAAKKRAVLEALARRQQRATTHAHQGD